MSGHNFAKSVGKLKVSMQFGALAAQQPKGRMKA